MTKKKRLKMPSAFTILFILITLIAICTWFIPAGKYDVNSAGKIVAGTYHHVKGNSQGLWDILMAPVLGMVGDKKTEGAISVSLFILMIGGFLGVVNRTKALDAGISSIVKKYQGREKFLIPILMFLFALGGTTYGMGEETIAFYPLLIPVMMACGFDTLTAVAIGIVGSQIGCLASTVNPFATGVASQSLGISPGDGLFPRLILFVLTVAAGIIYVYRYAEKVQKDPKKSLTYNRREADIEEFEINQMTKSQLELDKKQKRVLIVFALSFVFMIIGLIPWTSINPHFTFFEQFTQKLNHTPVLNLILGHNIVPLGQWYFSEITTLFLFMSIVIMFVYGMKEEDFVNAFLTGMGDFISVAMIVATARGLQIVMNNGLITGTILHWGEQTLHGLSQSIFIILTFIFYILMSFLIPSTSGLAAATMNIIGPLAQFAHVSTSLVVTAFQAGSGWVNLVTPTSGIVMGALAIAHINVTIWWKWIAKLMLILFVIIAVFLGLVAIF
ncbi:YfcC family protein [Lactobacillus psittaci]|uniref:C4-dicarboxylate anaerobic carrier, arginine transporter n=1 Tax=Lactobacillus psittaci DSM 15354 TaxID=1122152 RepID=A0A0R1S3G5_9LACO|nr:YfcC family protein [Lactobacillus psittaci]KRL62132.1 C4-dicarboxylate anaerobic carrier, arginine transporter [Lactobacillus psittaci DSM 15354]